MSLDPKCLCQELLLSTKLGLTETFAKLFLGAKRTFWKHRSFGKAKILAKTRIRAKRDFWQKCKSWNNTNFDQLHLLAKQKNSFFISLG